MIVAGLKQDKRVSGMCTYMYLHCRGWVWRGVALGEPAVPGKGPVSQGQGTVSTVRPCSSDQ